MILTNYASKTDTQTPQQTSKILQELKTRLKLTVVRKKYIMRTLLFYIDHATLLGRQTHIVAIQTW